MWPKASITRCTLLDAGIRQQTPHHTGGDHQVIARPVMQRAELGLQRARALVDKEHVVACAVFVPVIHRLVGAGDGQHDLAVAHHRQARFDSIAARRRGDGPKMAVPQRPLLLVCNLRALHRLHPLDLCRRPQVINQRLRARKAVDAHQLLVIQRAVRLAKLGMAFVGELAEAVVVGHSLGPRLKVGCQVVSECQVAGGRWQVVKCAGAGCTRTVASTCHLQLCTL